MPTKSAKQEKFMQAVAHNKAFAKKVGVPQSVGKEFTSGKRTKRYAEGGLSGIAKNAEDLMGKVDSMANVINYGSTSSSLNTPSTTKPEPVGFNSVVGFKKGGSAKSSASRRGDGCAKRGKTKGRMV